MRRTDREITDPVLIRNIFDSATECHLAFADQGRPYGVTMNFAFEKCDSYYTIWLHAALEGRKIEIIKRNPHVYFFAESGLCFHQDSRPDHSPQYTMYYCSVAAPGIARFVSDPDEKRRALAAIVRRFSDTGLANTPDRVFDITCVIAVELEAVTAKQNPRLLNQVPLCSNR